MLQRYMGIKFWVTNMGGYCFKEVSLRIYLKYRFCNCDRFIEINFFKIKKEWQWIK
jgi:hypothetical protein